MLTACGTTIYPTNHGNDTGGAGATGQGGASSLGTGGVSEEGVGGVTETGGVSTEGTGGSSASTDAGAVDAATPQSCAPAFPKTGSYGTTIGADSADVYYPVVGSARKGPFPIALLLQGANVARAHYAPFANGVASYGFVVVVPDHAGLLGLYAEQSEVPAVLGAMKAEDQRADSPVKGLVDGSKLVLLGHSYGGVAGLGAAQGTCNAPFCTGTFTRPTELLAGAFYGTNEGALPAPITTAPVHVALIQGSVDGQALPADAKATYGQLSDAPRALFTVEGANHYGICDVNNPAGAAADANAPTGSRPDELAAIVGAAGAFLRAAALKDPACLTYLAGANGTTDGLTTVTAVLH